MFFFFFQNSIFGRKKNIFIVWIYCKFLFVFIQINFFVLFDFFKIIFVGFFVGFSKELFFHVWNEGKSFQGNFFFPFCRILFFLVWNHSQAWYWCTGETRVTFLNVFNLLTCLKSTRNKKCLQQKRRRIKLSLPVKCWSFCLQAAEQLYRNEPAPSLILYQVSCSEPPALHVVFYMWLLLIMNILK